MATMLPPVAPEAIAVDSERLVYEALSRLPDDYTIMHSYPWLRPGRDNADGPLLEGEADFLVLHPNRGMLVLEVKGGNPELRGRNWFRGTQPMRDPFDQARRNRYALLDAVEARTQRGIVRNQFTHGDVVIFPHHLYRGELPFNADQNTLLDASSLQDVEPHIVAAFAAWSRGSAPLSAETYRRLINTLLPKLRLMRCVGADLQQEARRLLQLTQDQGATLAGLLASPRVLIEGVAGSGKTLLALEFAVTVAERGERALVLCFNKHLAAWMREQALVEPRLKEATGLVHIDTFHAFAFDLAERAGVEFDVPKGDAAARFWDEEAPMLIEQAIEVIQQTGEDPLYDVVIVDEGQDFLRDWWTTVESLVRGGARGSIYVFLDLHQSLRGAPEIPSIVLPARFSLSVNCRNTTSIALSGARVVNAKVRVLPGAPKGEAPSLRRAATQAAQAGLVIAEVKSLLSNGLRPDQIAIIGPASHTAGSLARIAEIGGATITTDAAKWRTGEGLIVTTSKAFKGLEADVVVLYDLSGFNERFTRADLYVAWTRAKHRLILICHGSVARNEIEQALSEIAV